MTNADFAEIAGLKKLINNGLLYKGVDYYDSNNKYLCSEEKWLPRLKIEQAELVLQAWLDKDGYRSYSAYYANHSREHRIDLETTGKDGAEIVGTGISKELAEAICTAVEEAGK